ncbi:hypothetical protein PanWU01x14_133700 [Parasponia andersonii]|uniref:Uncharacterized protein n=1 Tax=Parasponia andersonii TaxID=3476 RepID=A0A2P5CPX9_PARAD|nr:hypothetical protein PanWU01x14_133700 [Parasponia andersonii]
MAIRSSTGLEQIHGNRKPSLDEFRSRPSMSLKDSKLLLGQRVCRQHPQLAFGVGLVVGSQSRRVLGSNWREI